MEERYSRNRLYISPAEQEEIKGKRILLGGAGLGSVIAECALRFGFERITIVDGDGVEESNLNRQNYCHNDIGKSKAETLAKRLLAINPHAEIEYHNVMISYENLSELIEGHDIAINALDFNSDIPFAFDEECKRRGIPILHPYNFGWAGFLTIVSPHGDPITTISDNPSGFELKMANYVTRYCASWQNPKDWLQDIIEQYGKEIGIMPPPQLSVGSWIAAGYCVNTMFRLSTSKEVRFFPKYYLSSSVDE
ncbi:MAG: ThiF family adenylyltransferase [Bacteroidales bacterium]|nr:ThiF family adenylyltransferase [Bacteroidales bacterium]